MSDKKEDKKKKKETDSEHDGSKFIELDPVIEEESGVLSVAQRKARGRSMKRNKAKIKRGREKAAKKKASTEVLKTRAKKKALEMVKDKLAGKRSYKELSPSEKVQVDKRAKKVPSSRIASMSKRMLPKVKKNELDRMHKQRMKKEELDVNTLMSMVEGSNLVDQFIEAHSHVFLDEMVAEVRTKHVLGGFSRPVDVYAKQVVEAYGVGDVDELAKAYRECHLREGLISKFLGLKSDDEIEQELKKLPASALKRWVDSISPKSAKRVLSGPEYKKYLKAIEMLGLKEESEPKVTAKQMKAFETVVDKLFKTFEIDFEFTKHFHDRINDARNDPGITLQDLSITFKKLYAAMKKDGNTLQKHKDAEAVLKDLQQDLNLPIAVEYDRKNDELDVIMKTIMRKKNFRTPNDIIKV